jgi:hypothetical protein
MFYDTGTFDFTPCKNVFAGLNEGMLWAGI